MGCYISSKATQTPSHIPAAHQRLGFVSDRRRKRLTPSTKLRLRKPLAVFSAQNDRLVDCLVIVLKSGRLIVASALKVEAFGLILPYRLFHPHTP